MRRGLPALTALASLALAPDASACAGCRNPSLAVTRSNQGPLGEGAVRLGLSATGTAIHVVHEAGCRDAATCDELPVQPSHLHDQRLYPLELRLAGEYGFDDTFGVEAQLPFRVVKTTVEYKTLEGAPYQPLDEGVHHRDETVAGLADAWLLLRAGATLERWWLALRGGVSLPIGRTEENPFELGDRGVRHQHIQLGSGTFDPIAVAEASGAFDRVKVQAFVQGQLPLYANEHGYRAPWRVYGGASLGTQLFGQLSGFLGLEGFHEAAEKWDGEVRQDGNLGRSELLIAANLSQVVDATELSLSVRVPIWRDIVTGDEPPGTLSSPLTLGVGVTHVLDGRRD